MTKQSYNLCVQYLSSDMAKWPNPESASAADFFLCDNALEKDCIV